MRPEGKNWLLISKSTRTFITSVKDCTQTSLASTVLNPWLFSVLNFFNIWLVQLLLRKADRDTRKSSLTDSSLPSNAMLLTRSIKLFANFAKITLIWLRFSLRTLTTIVALKLRPTTTTLLSVLLDPSMQLFSTTSSQLIAESAHLPSGFSALSVTPTTVFAVLTCVSLLELPFLRE